MQNSVFVPETLTLGAETTVTWTNEDSTAHAFVRDIFGSPNLDVFSGHIHQGETFTSTFNNPGTYRYCCSVHPNQINGTTTVQ